MGATTSNKTNGLDVSASMQLMQSQNTQSAVTFNAMNDNHRESMEAMKHAMAEMRASQQSSDEKFQQMVVSMQNQSSTMMMSMSTMMKSMMDMMGPVMMGGANSGLNGSVLGCGVKLF